ncbi:putative membrane protein [Rickettsia parkeri str. Tate's Hell]|uniref:Membrane protein n=1 Tax=Rickettsia parkeri str. Tate's Hell TaxID=1359189 RepID=A0ABR5DNL9_RICPA|nr:putative membrane protein [Rickettsia parkeri str. AT\
MISFIIGSSSIVKPGQILIKLTLIACLFSFLGALILYAYT